MKIKLKLMSDFSEIVQFYLPHIQIGIQHNKMSYFDDMRALCHWHEDIELIQVIAGEFYFYVNGKIIFLQQGDGLIVNSKAMHYGYSVNQQDCEFTCVLINPNIFGCNSDLYRNFVEPVIKSASLEYSVLRKNNLQHLELIEQIKKFEQLYIKLMDNQSVDMESLAVASQLWKQWFDLVSSELTMQQQEEHRDIIAQKKMVSFIYQNYMHPLNLENIASSANICRTKCCLLFKKYINQSPIDFLNTYRLGKAKELLSTTSMSVTEVALSCGFNNLSYFSKQFEKATKYTPKKYQLNSKK